MILDLVPQVGPLRSLIVQASQSHREPSMFYQVARMFFLERLGGLNLSYTQSAILLALGLQCKTLEDLEVWIPVMESIY